jgi:hypothetical protein
MASASEREVGYFPLSIATSLAFEGALGQHPTYESTGKFLHEYPQLWVNVKTAFRNYYNAIGKDNVPGIELSEIIQFFYLELEQVRQTAMEQTNGKMVTTFYVCDYLGLDRRFKHAIIRKDTTENQVLYTKTMTAVISQILKMDEKLVKVYKLKIDSDASGKALMLTHVPYDLTTKAFTQLALLESHTGAIKERNQWYTKYYNGKDLPMIPFREDFLPVFGDSETFKPLPMVYRKTLIELGVKYNWSFATTKDKILFGINSLKDRFLADTLKQYLLFP